MTLISEYVAGMAEDLENAETLEETDLLDPLDVRLTVGLDGSIRSIEVLDCYGGPTVWVNVTNQTIHGSWGTESHSTHFDNSALEYAHDYFAELYEAN